jgi:hypothetical protein
MSHLILINQLVSSKDAITLQQELESLIVRLESANLAASVHTTIVNVNKPQSLKAETPKLISTATTDLSLEET